MSETKIGFMGGSGLYDMDALTDRAEIEVSTPFGSPSDAIISGKIGDVPIAFLPRHGRGHRISPSEIPVRANIWALKSLGVKRIVSVSAVGSLEERVSPLDLVVPDQIIDRTSGRAASFFGEGIVAHVGLADPFCDELRQAAIEQARKEVTVHEGGAYLVIEGPQFSTRAESEMYRRWGARVIGMTAQPEARLAREAEICYVTLAFVTDYDVWRPSEEDVSVDMVIQNLLRNIDAARRIIAEMARNIPPERDCGCSNALENAIITSRDDIPAQTREKLSLMVNKYLD